MKEKTWPMEIPKVVHYCWFGKKTLPKSAWKCIESWRRFLPGYEIRRWDESNFDVNINSYTRKAYRAGKYAFVSDYARIWILYNHGGLYFDTDVELIRGIDDIVDGGAFIGCETPFKSDKSCYSQSGAPWGVPWVNPGLGIGVPKGLNLLREILKRYEIMEFVPPGHKSAVENVVSVTTRILTQYGLEQTSGIQSVAGVKVYPSDYFCPVSTEDGKLRLSENTRSIHWFDQSWQSPVRKYGRRIILAVGGVQLKKKLKKMIYKNYVW